MSSKTVESRVVEMDFDNSKFLSGVTSTVDALTGLTTAFAGVDNSSVFENLENGAASAGNVINQLGYKFDTWKIVAMTAISNVTNRLVDGLIVALDKAKGLIDDLTFSNISLGFDAYQEELKNVNTIMRATDLPIDTVEQALEKIRWYTDETSYEYAAMVETIKEFTSQGIGLTEAVQYAQGFANMAGLAGAEASEATHAFSGFAKAIQSGQMNRQIWTSWITTAGLSTVNTKKIFLDAAVAAGTLVKSSENVWVTNIDGVEAAKVTVENFEDTLTEYDWLTKKVLIRASKEMAKYTDMIYLMQDAWGMDEVTDVIERFNGITDTSSEDFEIFKKVLEATTDTAWDTEKAFEKLVEIQNSVSAKGFQDAQSYRTFADAINTVKTAIVSATSSMFKKLFGNAEQAKELWTRFGGWMYDLFAAPFVAFDDLLGEWTKREDVIEGLAALGRTLTTIVNAIGNAFKKVFGIITAKDIDNFSASFRAFAESIEESVGDGSAFSTVLETIFTIILKIIDYIKSLWKVTQPLRESITHLAKSIAGLVYKILEVIAGSKKWTAEGSILQKLCDNIAIIIDKIATVIDNIDVKKLINDVMPFLENVKSLLKPIWEFINSILTKIASFDFSSISATFNAILEPFTNIWGTIKKVFGIVWDTIKKVWGKIIDFFKDEDGTIDWGKVFNITKLVAFLQTMWDNEGYIRGFGRIFKKIKDGLSVLKQSFDDIMDVFYSISTKNYAEAIFKFALTIGILVACILILSQMDEASLEKGAAGLSFLIVAMGFVLKALQVLSTLVGPAGEFKLAGLAASFVLIAIGIGILAASLLIFVGALALFTLVTEKMDGVTEGFNMMARTVGLLTLSMLMLAQVSPWAIVAAAGILVLSIALIILGAALAIFVSVCENMTNVDNGLLVMGGVLAGVILALLLVSKIGPQVVLAAASLLIVSVALIALGAALAIFIASAAADPEGNGIGRMIGTIIVLTIALAVLGSCAPKVLLAAVALVTGATAVLILSAAMLVASVACLIFIAGLYLLSPALDKLGTTISQKLIETGTAINVALTVIGAGIKTVIESFFLGIGEGIGKGITAIADGINDFGESIKNVGTNTESFGTSLTTLKDIPFTSIAIGIGELALAFSALINDTKDLGTRVTELIEFNDTIAGIQDFCDGGVGILQTFVDEWTLMGSTALNNFKKAVENGTAGVISSITNMITSSADSAKVNLSSFYFLGKSAVEGYARGIRTNTWIAQNAASSMATSAYSATKKSQKSRSPSRLFAELGSYVSEGYAIGIDSEKSRVENSAKNLVASVAKTVDGIIDSDFDPVIRPVLDLSSIEENAKNISGILGNNSVLMSGQVQSLLNQNGGYSNDLTVSLDSESLKALSSFKETPIQTNTTVSFEGSLARLGTILYPVIKKEETRIGNNLLKSNNGG